MSAPWSKEWWRRLFGPKWRAEPVPVGIAYHEISLAPGEVVHLDFQEVEDPPPLMLRLDASPVLGQAHRLSEALVELLDRRPEVRDLLIDGIARLLETGAAFDLDRSPAIGAGELRIQLKPTEALLEFVRACGASDRELALVQKSFLHDPSSFIRLVFDNADHDGLSRGER